MSKKIWRILLGFDCNFARVKLLATKTTWMTIEMAINGLIYSVSCTPRWPRELWGCNLCFLSEISHWSLFDWYWEESSTGRNRLTKQGQSSPSAGREKATTLISASTSSLWSSPVLFLSAFLYGRGRVVSHRSHPRENTKEDLFWLYGETV